MCWLLQFDSLFAFLDFCLFLYVCRGSKDEPMGVVRVPVSEMSGKARVFKLLPMAVIDPPRPHSLPPPGK